MIILTEESKHTAYVTQNDALNLLVGLVVDNTSRYDKVQIMYRMNMHKMQYLRMFF